MTTTTLPPALAPSQITTDATLIPVGTPLKTLTIPTGPSSPRPSERGAAARIRGAFNQGNVEGKSALTSASSSSAKVDLTGMVSLDEMGGLVNGYFAKRR